MVSFFGAAGLAFTNAKADGEGKAVIIIAPNANRMRIRTIDFLSVVRLFNLVKIHSALKSQESQIHFTK